MEVHISGSRLGRTAHLNFSACWAPDSRSLETVRRDQIEFFFIMNTGLQTHRSYTIPPFQKLPPQAFNRKAQYCLKYHGFRVGSGLNFNFLGLGLAVNWIAPGPLITHEAVCDDDPAEFIILSRSQTHRSAAIMTRQCHRLHLCCCSRHGLSEGSKRCIQPSAMMVVKMPALSCESRCLLLPANVSMMAHAEYKGMCPGFDQPAAYDGASDKWML